MSDDWKIFSYSDIHSHVPGEGRVTSVEFTDGDFSCGRTGETFTIGVHPWVADRDIDWAAFEELLHHPGVVGVGEAGLDAMRGASAERQLEVFERQIQLSEKLRLPLVIHNVRSDHRILELKKKYRPTVPWIVHGFTGNAERARHLVEAGLHLSLGKRFNPEVEKSVPKEMLHHETDEERQ